MNKSILVISASPNKQGNSASLAQYFISEAHKNYTFEWVYLYDLDIPFFTNENRKALVEQDERNKDVRMLIEKIEAVDTIILTTPIWNFSVPGMLKNTLDRIMASGRIWSEEKQKKVPGWKGKTFYLLFTMGAPLYGLPLDSLGIMQVCFTLKYFGASPKIKHLEFNCGNGSKNLISDRPKAIERLKHKGRKLFL